MYEKSLRLDLKAFGCSSVRSTYIFRHLTFKAGSVLVGRAAVIKTKRLFLCVSLSILRNRTDVQKCCYTVDTIHHTHTHTQIRSTGQTSDRVSWVCTTTQTGVVWGGGGVGGEEGSASSSPQMKMLQYKSRVAHPLRGFQAEAVQRKACTPLHRVSPPSTRHIRELNTQWRFSNVSAKTRRFRDGAKHNWM